MTRNPPTGKAADSRLPDGVRILQGTQEFIPYSTNSSIRVCSSDAHPGDTHYHSAVEILFVESGRAEYTLSDRTYTVVAGQVLILPPQCPHALVPAGDARFRMFLFEPHIFNSLRDLSVYAQRLSQIIFLDEDTPLRRKAEELLLQVASVFEEHKPMWNSLCYSLLIRLYSTLARDWALQSGEDENVNIDSEIMNSVLTYISQHYADNLHLDDVAAFSGFSRYYFSRMFKKYIGVSFTDYLGQCRLETAMKLLTHTKLPIRKVAEQSGFKSVATFNRIFRASMSCTPSRYRSLYGGA